MSLKSAPATLGVGIQDAVRTAKLSIFLAVLGSLQHRLRSGWGRSGGWRVVLLQVIEMDDATLWAKVEDDIRYKSDMVYVPFCKHKGIDLLLFRRIYSSCSMSPRILWITSVVGCVIQKCMLYLHNRSGADML